MMSYKNFLITIFFLASCSNEVSDNQQNLSELMQPNQNYFISQYECTLSQNNNLNDLEQYIPKLSQLLKNHNFEYQLDFYFSDSQDDEIKNFIINVKNKESIDQENLSLFINSENNILNDPLRMYSISYKADFLNSDSSSRNFYWHNFFNSSIDRDNFYASWIDSEDSIEIKDLFSEQSECFSSNSYIGYKVF